VVRKGESQRDAIQVKAGVPHDVTDSDAIELTSLKLGTTDYRSIESTGFSAWALSRRILCETRDRLSVLKPKVGMLR